MPKPTEEKWSTMGHHGTVGHSWAGGHAQGWGTHGVMAQKRVLWLPSGIPILGPWRVTEAAQATLSSAPWGAHGIESKAVVSGKVRSHGRSVTGATMGRSGG